MNRKVDSGLSPRTVQYCHAVLRAALKTAVRRRLGASERGRPGIGAQGHAGPGGAVDRGRGASSSSTRRPGEPARGAFVVTALALGLRRGEVLGLAGKTSTWKQGRLWVRHGPSSARRARGWCWSSPSPAPAGALSPCPPSWSTRSRTTGRRQAEQRLAQAGSQWQDDRARVYHGATGGPYRRTSLQAVPRVPGAGGTAARPLPRSARTPARLCSSPRAAACAWSWRYSGTPR